MPRVHIHVQDREDIEVLEQQDDWEAQIGAVGERPARPERSANGRGYRRPNGAEALDRKYSERRKRVHRGGKR